MRFPCGSAGCQSNGPSSGLSRTKSKFQRFESDSVWRWSSSAACCRASSGDDGKPKRQRLTRDKQPVLGTIRGRPPLPKREYEGNIILTSSETGAARTRVLMMIPEKNSKLKTKSKSMIPMAIDTLNTTNLFVELSHNFLATW